MLQTMTGVLTGYLAMWRRQLDEEKHMKEEETKTIIRNQLGQLEYCRNLLPQTEEITVPVKRLTKGK